MESIEVFAAHVQGKQKLTLRRWGAGNQDPFPANRGFRAPAGCQRRRSRTRAGYGHPEATRKPPSGHLVANR
jgi:hypothetical protein